MAIEDELLLEELKQRVEWLESRVDGLVQRADRRDYCSKYKDNCMIFMKAFPHPENEDEVLLAHRVKLPGGSLSPQSVRSLPKDADIQRQYLLLLYSTTGGLIFALKKNRTFIYMPEGVALASLCHNNTVVLAEDWKEGYTELVNVLDDQLGLLAQQGCSSSAHVLREGSIEHSILQEDIKRYVRSLHIETCPC
jgi:hypothetical protein